MKENTTYQIDKDELMAFFMAIAKIEKENHKDDWNWIPEKDALSLLNIGKTSLWKMRAAGSIRYTQTSRKHILYDKKSILDWLDNHAQDTF